MVDFLNSDTAFCFYPKTTEEGDVCWEITKEFSENVTGHFSKKKMRCFFADSWALLSTQRRGHHMKFGETLCGGFGGSLVAGWWNYSDLTGRFISPKM